MLIETLELLPIQPLSGAGPILMITIAQSVYY